ncbi:MAG TPA: hypothetical protein VGO43_11715 [Pyrinomonadaceae bacterium]|jgi:hypothetical protein|nr:hypothetical protein [Pyrinomonadaceae bacterium]
MVNRIHSDTPRDPERNHPTRNSLSERTASTRPIYVDDIIVSLANAHENRRARQVTEWQRLGTHNLHARV